ncbi:MAG: hypothetical protein H0U44_08570, partial [Flavisolibacter sp.]|nr:hypothetical protein [Flavisolibacter sp.]
MRYPSFLSVIILLLWQHNAGAQGCSDAGFCSIGNLASHGQQTLGAQQRSLKLLLPAGVGDEAVFVFTPGLEYTQKLNNHWAVQGKITANYASGNLGSAFGAGDVILSGTYSLAPQKIWKHSVTLGVKLPLNQSNLKEGGRSLPMQYQSSLGTVDFIAGFSLASDRWQFAAGYQQPLTGANRNSFLPQYWSKPEAAAYPASNDFNRRGDVLVRTAYSFQRIRKASLDVGLLGIYHLGEDSYIDGNIQNSAIAIKGSSGLTLNATALLRVPLGTRWELGLTGAVPLVVRD